MNIKRIKEKIELLKNKKIKLKVNGSRNQIEVFEGIITETYNFIFIVETNNLKKSFSYSDLFINYLEIID